VKFKIVPNAKRERERDAGTNLGKQMKPLEQAASAPALQTLGVWVVTGLVSTKTFSMKSVGLCFDTDGDCMKLCYLKDMR
jgi:hypothetical protein